MLLLKDFSKILYVGYYSTLIFCFQGTFVFFYNACNNSVMIMLYYGGYLQNRLNEHFLFRRKPTCFERFLQFYMPLFFL